MGFRGMASGSGGRLEMAGLWVSVGGDDGGGGGRQPGGANKGW